ncbi:MAG TPA: hypothetical protein VF309_09350 [Usitatibacter sp.]
MNALATLALALAAAASTPLVAADGGACRPGAAMSGMRERIVSLQEQMDRIEWTADRAEQRRLMDLHAKRMREGMREIRNRELEPACRMEMMTSMMDVMIRHQQAMEDPEERR